MRLLGKVAVAVVISLALCGLGDSATFMPGKPRDARKINIVRQYDIPVVKGRKTVAALPAMMSFWGATNQQVVLDSSFTYSVKPDKIAVTADDRGMKRRNYELTWDSPQVDKITVTQTLAVEISCTALLQTAAKVPYPKEILAAYATSLESTKEMNLDNPELDKIIKSFSGKTVWAEETVELVCDWVNENIPFKSKTPTDVDTVLKNKYGNCEGMANVAVAILRKMGIPAETVSANFVSGSGHAFMEVYFPDAGWVFYDLSNWNRGYKSLDCLLTVGWCFRVGTETDYKWIEGDFLTAKDAVPYKEDERHQGKLRPGPKNEDVTGASVVNVKTPDTVKVRHLPLSSLIMDLSIPPGKRDYSNDNPNRSATQPASGPASKPTTMPAATKR